MLNDFIFNANIKYMKMLKIKNHIIAKSFIQKEEY